ncbi:MAG: N-6 DNA methylase, partial [Leptospiraceae bacterium]|nr:N-6 DNA methylase [Leptospiraceae bacterium]
KRTDYIWQAYSYSYSTQSLSASKKVDFALLTDFEEFRFFDCTFPVKDNSILNNYCVIDWTYKDYINKFDELWDYFEKENVRRNSLSGATSRPTLYINEKKIKANRISPDKAFLNDLDNEESGWRITLAKDIKKYQPDFTSEFITQSVQLILDRFIFIKVLSDREIEEDIIKQIVGRIQKEETSAHSVFEECKDIFHDLDKTYNGSIFSERAELDGVKVGNKTLVGILKDFLPENSRYNFKVIPVEILGTIYEQFLGKVVTTTDKRAKIEYKPEVRKAGGVYYTPDYIVNYIVEKTVGEKLKDCKTIDDLLEIKICDPACGSGSFLIAAYDALIQWTISYYKNKKLTREEQKTVYTDSNGDIRLTSKIKRDILRSCIYGVDIDAQAVEVTKMSLSLKALENTTHYEVHNEVTLFHVCVLPPLEENVKCGNSLVGTDIYDGKLQLDNNIEKILKPFDWKTEFSIFKEKQGFDAVIGNPPYIRVQALDYIFTDYSKEKYEVAWRRVDISIMFIELANRIINPKGVNAYITSNQFLTTEYGRQARKFILEKSNIIEMVDFGDLPIFKDALTYVSIFVLGKGKTSSFNYFKAKSLEQKIKEIPAIKINSNSLSEDSFILGDNSKKKLLDKLIKNNPPLSTNAKCWAGLFTGKDDVLMFDKSKLNEITFEKEILLPVIRAQDCSKYGYSHASKYVIYPYKETNNKTLLLEEKELAKNYPKSYEYLKSKKNLLNVRKDSRKEFSENKSWYSLTRFGKYSTFHKPKIVSPGEVKSNKFALDETGAGFSCARVFAITSEDESLNLLCLLGILNSKVVEYYLHSVSPLKQGGYYSYSSKFIDSVPIPKEILNQSFEKTKELLKSVQDILAENKRLSAVKLDSDKTSIQRKIKYLDDRINSLAYEFYNLTPEEIKIVEGE